MKDKDKNYKLLIKIISGYKQKDISFALFYVIVSKTKSSLYQSLILNSLDKILAYKLETKTMYEKILKWAKRYKIFFFIKDFNKYVFETLVCDNEYSLLKTASKKIVERLY